MSSIDNSTVAKQSKAIDKSIIAVASVAMVALTAVFAINPITQALL